MQENHDEAHERPKTLFTRVEKRERTINSINLKTRELGPSNEWITIDDFFTPSLRRRLHKLTPNS